jgi:hypothetical protein
MNHPESRIYVYQQMVGILYQHSYFIIRTVHDISRVAIASSSFQMDQRCSLIETIMNQKNEDKNKVLVKTAILASFVKKVVPEMKYFSTEEKQRGLAQVPQLCHLFLHIDMK